MVVSQTTIAVGAVVLVLLLSTAASAAQPASGDVFTEPGVISRPSTGQSAVIPSVKPLCRLEWVGLIPYPVCP